jgi:APA family basic amino acid/polyamine antiporter
MPVSGGTYAYGYAYLNPGLGFTAGWMFLCAKVASAATAALGFAGYLHQALGIEGFVVPVAVGAAAVLTAIVVAGIRNSSRTNIFIVSITMLALFFFVIAGSLAVSSAGSQSWQPFLQSNNGGASPGASLLQAAAPMFVAFTGYARKAPPRYAGPICFGEPLGFASRRRNRRRHCDRRVGSAWRRESVLVFQRVHRAYLGV